MHLSTKGTIVLVSKQFTLFLARTIVFCKFLIYVVKARTEGNDCLYFKLVTLFLTRRTKFYRNIFHVLGQSMNPFSVKESDVPIADIHFVYLQWVKILSEFVFAKL